MKSRFRFYLKLFVAVFAVAAVSTVLWFIFRIEKYIISRLPKEVTVEELSVSFINRAFVLKGARVMGKPGTLCEGKLVLEVGEATGKFLLKERKLTSLSLRQPKLTVDTLKRGCFGKSPESPVKISDALGPEGLRLEIAEGAVPAPELGELAVNAALTLQENEHGATVLRFEKLTLAGPRLVAEAKKAALAFVKGGDGMHLSDGEIMATLKLNHLEKMPRLNTKKLKLLAGDSDVKFSADIRRGEWTVYTVVDLKRVKLAGEPFYNMPLLKLTPENMWPMVEDNPGFFSFNFKTKAEESRLVKTFAADFRIALTRKVKGNLKKKIPVLPF